MIARLFDRGVVLRMGAREIRAGTTGSLRSTLTAYAALNAARITELGKLADAQLAAHATWLAALAADLSDRLSHRDCNPTEILTHVREARAPLDEVWINAIAQVSQWPHTRSDYQHALLDALVEYLASERDCARTLIDNRARAPLDHSRSGAADCELLLHQQLIFDVACDDDADNQPIEFDRLVKGEPLDIPIAAGQCIQILLAHYRFALICGTPWRLVDRYGEDLRLTPGRCVTGRSNECDLLVHDSFRAISRRHAVLETQGTDLLRITDISSLGTFTPRAYLD